MKSDLSNVKVGDKIWTIQEGWTEVVIFTNGDNDIHPIKIGSCYYTLDGKFEDYDKHPSAFLENPFEKGITREVEEEILKGFRDYLFYHDDFSPFDTSGMNKYLDQKYKPLPTAEEAADKLGITVEQLKQISNG